MALNNPDGIDVNPVQPLNVLKNILLVVFADDVSIDANNVDGNDVNPVQPLNVPLNISLVYVADCVLMALNNVDGIDVKTPCNHKMCR